MNPKELQEAIAVISSLPYTDRIDALTGILEERLKYADVSETQKVLDLIKRELSGHIEARDFIVTSVIEFLEGKLALRSLWPVIAY